jgi:hypothetical protein
MEVLSTRKKLNPVVKIGAILVGATAFVGGGAIVINHNDPAATFERHYMQNGQCLNNSPFDTDKGATITTRSSQNVDGDSYAELLVTPRSPNSYVPAVLKLVVETHGYIFGEPTFNPADHQTLSAMYDFKCPGIDEGQ